MTLVCHHQNAPATLEFLIREMPQFILPLLLSPNSPDLNPVDYSMWSILQEDVQHTHHWCRRPQTSRHNQNWLGYAASRHHRCSCASVASTSFSLCHSMRWSFRALFLILSSCFCDNCNLWSLRSLVELNSRYFVLIFLQLSVTTLYVIHDDHLIHKVK